jgi:hypothetical protein
MQNPHHTVTVFNSYYTELDMFDVYSVVLIWCNPICLYLLCIVCGKAYLREIENSGF